MRLARRRSRCSDALRDARLPPSSALRGFDPTLLLVLNLAGTFVFGLSGGLAGVRARLDVFGVVVLAVVVGLAGGITRDLLIGIPPPTFRDWRYLAVAGGAGLVTCRRSSRARARLERRSSYSMPPAWRCSA